MDCLVNLVFVGLATHCIPNHDLFPFCSSVFELGRRLLPRFHLYLLSFLVLGYLI